MFDIFMLTIKVLTLLTPTGHDAADSHLFALTCARNSTGLVSAERLCAVAFVESRHNYRALNGGGHCGAWQQHPDWSAMWGDDCYDNDGRLTCKQPGGLGLTCGELMDVVTAGRVAARHLHYLTRRHGDRALCRYAGARGERCTRYAAAVARAERHLSR